MLQINSRDEVSKQYQYKTENCSGVPRNFVRGGVNKFSCGQGTVRTGIWGAVAPYPLVKGSGGCCNLVHEISFPIIKVS